MISRLGATAEKGGREPIALNKSVDLPPVHRLPDELERAIHGQPTTYSLAGIIGLSFASILRFWAVAARVRAWPSFAWTTRCAIVLRSALSHT